MYFSQGWLVKKYLLKLGVDCERILCEAKSDLWKNTWLSQE